MKYYGGLIPLGIYGLYQHNNKSAEIYGLNTIDKYRLYNDLSLFLILQNDYIFINMNTTTL